MDTVVPRESAKRIYLLTGAGGHLGNTVCRLLLERGETVRVLILPGDPAPALKDMPVEKVYGDITDPSTLGSFFANDEEAELYLFHIAGLISIVEKTDPALALVNVEGTRNLLRLSKEHKVKRFVYTSTVHAIEEKPQGEMISEVTSFSAETVQGAYAKTKAEASQLVMNAAAEGLDALIVHPSALVGPYDYANGHITELLIRYAQGKLPMLVRGGYDFVDVRDVAAASVTAMDKGVSGNAYILSGHWYSIFDFIVMAGKILGRKKAPGVLPDKLASFVAAFVEVFSGFGNRKPLFTRYSLSTLKTNGLFSHAKASRDLDYYPRPLEETVYDTLLFLQEEARIPTSKLVKP